MKPFKVKRKIIYKKKPEEKLSFEIMGELITMPPPPR